MWSGFPTAVETMGLSANKYLVNTCTVECRLKNVILLLNLRPSLSQNELSLQTILLFSNVSGSI